MSGTYVLFDFCKAFDTVDHTILLNQLYKYGIRGIAHDWLDSYLYNRRQFVSFNNHCSDMNEITCGVPQGSILGPLLFLLYVNDIVEVSSVLLPILYSDDTSLFLIGKNINVLIHNMNYELAKVLQWLNCNKLSLNIKKSQYIVFRSIKNYPNEINTVKINNQTLNKVKSTKFLGVIIDEFLNWAEHINTVKTKISRGIGILCKARRVLKTSTLVTLYNSFVYPYINYCIEVWGGASDKSIKSLFKVQKRAVRIIKSASYLAHTQPIFHALNILNIYKIYEFKVALFMYKMEMQLLPSLFSDMFVKNSDVHNYPTRYAHNLRVTCKHKTKLSEQSIGTAAISIWNHISVNLDTNCSICTFKYKLKKYLIYHNIPNSRTP